MNEFVDDYKKLKNQIDVILELLPDLYLKAGLDSDAGTKLEGMRQAPETISVFNGKPVVVVTLFGSTGVGKSTLFSILTGVNVPAGDGRRPLTHRLFSAVPADLLDESSVRSIFPAFSVSFTDDTNILTERGKERELMYGPMNEHNGALYPVLVDVPDFNSVEEENRLISSRMVERAELVLFVMTNQSYATADSIRELVFCLKKSANTILLFNQVSSSRSAREMWVDLQKRADEPGSIFREKRGETELREILKSSPVYYLPRKEGRGLEDIKALDGQTSIEALLKSEKGFSLIHRKTSIRAYEGVQSAKEMLDRIFDKRRRAEKGIAELKQKIALPVGIKVSGSVPLGDFFRVLVDFSRNRSSFLSKIFSFPSFAARKGLILAKELVRIVSSRKDVTRDRAELEKERLYDELSVKRLIEKVRKITSEASLEVEDFDISYREKLRLFLELPLPEPPEEWEISVEHRLEDWARSHPVRSGMIPLISDSLITLASIALVIDLSVDGGIVTSGVLFNLGILGTAGAAGAVVAALDKFVGYFKLRSVLEEATELWRKQRSQTLSGHIFKAFLSPLAGSKMEKTIRELDEGKIKKVSDAISFLEKYIEKYGAGYERIP